MELQKAVALLKLEGKALTEEIITQAYNAIVEPVQIEAINAPTGELVKKHMATLDSLSKAKEILLKSINKPTVLSAVEQASPKPAIDISALKQSVVARQKNSQTSIIDIPEKDIQNLTIDTTSKEVKVKPQAHGSTEINNSSKSKLVPILLCAVLLGGGAVVYQQGWLNSFVDDLKPVDTELVAKQQTEGAQLLAEIKLLVQRLDKGQLELSTKLENAESDVNLDDVDYLETLRFTQRLTQEYLTEGSILPELAGKISQAQNILNNQQSKSEDNLQALQLLHDAKLAYENIWLQFNASKQLYRVQQSALQAQAKLMQALESYQLAAPIEVAQVSQLMETANATKQAWQYTHAISYYQEATPAFGVLLANIESLQEAKMDAFKAEKKVEKTVKVHALPPPDTQQASGLMEKAKISSRKGDTETAISTYQQAQQYWQKISAELAKQVKEIKETNIALEAKRELEAKQELEAKRELEAKQELEAKRELEAKLELEAKRALEAKNALEKVRLEKQAHQAKMLARYVGPLVSIKAGEFKMGSTDGEKSEKPVHSVNVKAFKMMAHEVTFKQWEACYNQGGCSYLPNDKGWGRGTRPVISVSFNDIVDEYIPWLNKITGVEFSLPSEAQWEYAARAGSTNRYSWGYGVGDNFANCISCSRLQHQRTVPVQSFEANRWGLYDMHGNVAEWTQDCWSENYNGAWGNDVARLDGNCNVAVLRGGAWNSVAAQLRSASREHKPMSNREPGNGFRLVQK